MEMFAFGVLGGVILALLTFLISARIIDKSEEEETESEELTSELNNLKTIIGLSRGDREIIDRAISHILDLEGELNERS